MWLAGSFHPAVKHISEIVICFASFHRFTITRYIWRVTTGMNYKIPTTIIDNIRQRDRLSIFCFGNIESYILIKSFLHVISTLCSYGEWKYYRRIRLGPVVIPCNCHGVFGKKKQFTTNMQIRNIVYVNKNKDLPKCSPELRRNPQAPDHY